MATKAIGSIAFIAGLGVGAVAAIFSQTFFPPTDDKEINDAGSPSGALLDSLQGITVSGQDAKLITVRVLGIERAKAVAMWGTKGKDGNEPTTFRRLTDLTTEHLTNIRDNSTRASEFELAVINSILEDRVAAGDADESVLED